MNVVTDEQQSDDRPRCCWFCHGPASDLGKLIESAEPPYAAICTQCLGGAAVLAGYALFDHEVDEDDEDDEDDDGPATERGGWPAMRTRSAE